VQEILRTVLEGRIYQGEIVRVTRLEFEGALVD
jgi:hypothetical protein